MKTSNNTVMMKGQLPAFSQTERGQDIETDSLVNALAERDARIGALANEILALQRAAEIKEKLLQQRWILGVQLSHQLHARGGAGERWLSLVGRPIDRLAHKLTGRQGVRLVPLHELEGGNGAWRSTGNDPYFLLVPRRDWRVLRGWAWLSFEFEALTPLNAQLFFDLGEGFGPDYTLNFSLHGKGRKRIPIFIPQNCLFIRLDPSSVIADFSLGSVCIERLTTPPVLQSPYLEQKNTYENLHASEDEVCCLRPLSQVALSVESGYGWKSEGSDPYFLVENIEKKLGAGWNILELLIQAEVPFGNAKLYFDYGKGFNEEHSLRLPFVSGELTRRVFKLDGRLHAIRFDPLEHAGRFSVDSFKMRAVSELDAYDHQVLRIRARTEKYRDLGADEIRAAIESEADGAGVSASELLQKHYSRTFPHNPGSSITYKQWIDKVEKPEFSDVAAIEMARQKFKTCPVISIVMPTYNTEARYLRLAIESVLNQSYPYWELCIADDASPKPHVRQVLEEYARRDSRIKVVFRPKNGHISAASNSALTAATGDYVALLDHDDELAPHALHFVAESLDQHPSAQIVYSDEDKIDDEGERWDPHFKSDWNPDLFFSQNYVSHLGVYRRDLLQRIGGFRLGVEGSQDQDLLLRCLPYVQPGEIVHVPRVLYHWRAVEGSTALAAGEKSYTTDAGIKALQDYFAAQGRDEVNVAAGLIANTYRVRYPIPQPEPLVSLLIPTRDMLVMLEPCIRSILNKTTYQNYEIIILDNESVEPATLHYFERIQAEDARVKVLPYHYPFNYSAINNFGARHAKGEVIGLINNDIEVISPEWLTEMVSHALRPEIGCVGAKLLYDDGTLQHAGVILGIGGVAGHSHKYFAGDAHGYFSRLKIIQNLSAVTAACLLVRKDVYDQVGGLEEGLRVAFNDVDFCIKVREAGYRNLWTPYAELYHHESKSRGAEDTPEKVARFNNEVAFIKTKWGAVFQRDPYYSQNLTMEHEDFSISLECRPIQ